MKNLFLILSIAVLFVSCKPNSEQRSTENINVKFTDKVIVVGEGSNCFISILDKDTAKLELNVTGDRFEGFLYYLPFESDSSLGSYEGTVHGDTLKGMFRFISEGLVSYEEVYFLMDGNKLKEGVGELEFRNDTTVVFNHQKAVSYGESYVFEKLECKENFISDEIKDFYFQFNPVNFQ